jgi:cell wall-associated NlpC family hydrolase
MSLAPEAHRFLLTYWKDLIGKPYTTGGDSPEGGFDCWGFVRHVYFTQGVELPPDPHEASALFSRVEPPYQWLDILTFKLPPHLERHVAVALDNDWFLHCSLPTNGVARSQRSRDFWRQSLKHGVRRCTSPS